MNKTIKFFALLSAVALVFQAGAASGAGTNAAAKPDALFNDPVIARGKGIQIKRSDLDAEIISARAVYAARGLAVPVDLDKQALRGLVVKSLLLSRATPEDKAKGRKQFETAFARFKTNSNLTDEQFEQKLKQQLVVLGQTRSQWEQQNIEQATIPFILEHELKATVTDADAKKYYDENTSRFEHPEMVRAAHILIATRDLATGTELTDAQKAEKRKLAEDLVKRARAGEDFGKMAKQYSEDPGSKDKGGEYTFGRGQMVPDFENAAFALNTNQVSDIVTTPYGYHIIKLYEKLPARKEALAGPDTKTTVRKPDGEFATIREILTEQMMQDQFADYTKKIQKDANVEILDESLKYDENALPDAKSPMKPPGVK